MTIIRLARGGARHRPFYRVVVADQRRSPQGRYIEVLGRYNPALKKEEGLTVDKARVEHWLARGAQSTRRVRSLLREGSPAAAAPAPPAPAPTSSADSS